MSRRGKSSRVSASGVHKIAKIVAGHYKISRKARLAVRRSGGVI